MNLDAIRKIPGLVVDDEGGIRIGETIVNSSFYIAHRMPYNTYWYTPFHSQKKHSSWKGAVMAGIEHLQENNPDKALQLTALMALIRQAEE